MGRLKWHAMGWGQWEAWSTQDGTFSPFNFELIHADLSAGYTLTVHDLRRKQDFMPYGLPILKLSFQHREWTLAQMQDWIETIRPMLPTFEGQQEQTIEELREAFERDRAQRKAAPTTCGFHHAFPSGAKDSTSCQCGKITKGFAQTRAKSA